VCATLSAVPDASLFVIGAARSLRKRSGGEGEGGGGGGGGGEEEEEES